MEIRITYLFKPLSRAAAFFLSEMGSSPTEVAMASFIAAILSALLFLFSLDLPFISAQTALTLAVVLIVLNAFLGDVEGMVEKRKKKKSILGGPLGTVMGDLSDFFILFGALAFLAMKDTYYNFGRVLFINLSYVEPGAVGHLGLGLITAIGILMLRRTAGDKEKRPGLWRRSERMYMLGFFGIIGVFNGLFSGMLFTGISVLTVSIYLSAAKRVSIFQGLSTSRSKRSLWMKIKRVFRKLGGLITRLLKLMLRAIGTVLLGIYISLEKLFGFLRRLLRPHKTKAASSMASSTYRHKPIKPFEGTISPSASSLPADKSEPMEQSGPEEVHHDSAALHREEPSKPSTIELPPPNHLLADNGAYSAGEEVGESMLVEYAPSDKKEEVLIDIVEFMAGEGKNVIVASTQPGSKIYRGRFHETRGIRVIDITDQPGVPSRDEIPMTNLEYLSEVFETLSKDHVFIFEPLSNLMLQIGISQSYKFISQTIQRLSKEGITFIVFLNKVGHDDKDISNFENIFMNIAVIQDGRLSKVR